MFTLKKLFQNTQFERYFLFFINVYIFFIYGIYSGSLGITLQQFGQILNLNTKELSFGLSTNAIFGCISSLIATYSLDKWNRNLQYAFDTLLFSIAIILFPFSNSSTMYLFYSGVLGFSAAVVNCINTIFVLELFRDNPSVFIQIFFFFYPLGSTFSRFLFTPFLDNSNLLSYNNTLSKEALNNESHSNSLSFFANLFNNVNKTNIWKPYLVVGIMMMSGSLMIFLVHFFKPFKNEKKKESVYNDAVTQSKTESIKYKDSDQEQMISFVKKRSRKQKILSVVFVILVCVIITLQVGGEINFSNFVPTFLTRLSTFDFDQTQASYISTILTGCVTIGRFLNIFLSLKIEPEFMIYVNFMLMIGGNFILTFLSHKSVKLIWTGIGLVGLGFSSTYPLIIAFVEKRYLMSNFLSSLLEFSCLFFVCFSPIIFGHILDNIPDYFIYINICSSILILFLFLLLHFLGNFRKI